MQETLIGDISVGDESTMCCVQDEQPSVARKGVGVLAAPGENPQEEEEEEGGRNEIDSHRNRCPPSWISTDDLYSEPEFVNF
jgi:hypothetical protein